MARHGDIRLVMKVDKNAGALVPIEDIPDELAAEVEEAYEALKDRPNARLRVSFDTKAEVEEWAALVRSYCAQRPDGELYFRRSPTPGLPEGTTDFRISDASPKEKKASERKHVDRSMPIK